MAFPSGLLPASWRGIPFFVHSISTRVGRRTAIHEYPFRDAIWVEDLGRGIRCFGFRGFMVGPLAGYQRDAMLLAMEKPGPGTLTHPTLGIFTCALVSFTSLETDEAQGVFELEMEFVETGTVEYPSASNATADGITLGSLNLLSASTAMFVSVIGTGAAVIAQLQKVVSAWVNLPLSLGSDAAALAGEITGLGATYGRYQGNPAQTAPMGSTPASILASALSAQASATAAARARCV